MTEEMNKAPASPGVPAEPTTPSPAISPFAEWTPTDWIWLGVLAISLLVGFGMTAFAPI